MHRRKYLGKIVFLLALSFSLPILAADLQELTSGIAKPKAPLPGAERVVDSLGTGTLQGKVDVDQVLDGLDPCAKIDDKLNGLRSCPADVGRNCVGVSIRLVVEEGKCVLHALDSQNNIAISDGREIGDFYGIHTGGVTDWGKISWTADNNFALEVVVDPSNRFQDANYYILKKTDLSEIRIAFAEIQYQSALEKQSVNNSGLKIPESLGLSAGAREAVERAEAKCKADFLCAQSKGRVRVENFREHLQNVVREGNLTAAGSTTADPDGPSIDPALAPNDVGQVSANEPVLGSSGCSFYPRLQTGGWMAAGGFIILIVMMMLTRRLVRSKSRRRR